jgi:hypothetical protein
MKRGAAVWLVLGLLVSTMGVWGATPHTQVSIWVARDVAPGPKVGLALNTCNVATLRLAAYRLEPTSLLIARAEKPVRPPTPRAPLRTWTVSMARKGEPPPRSERDVYRSRRVNLPPLPPGVYLITAQGDGTEVEVPGWRPWAVVNVTYLAVVVKRSPSKALTWVCHALSGLPLAGARATLYDQDQKSIASGVTRRDGTVVLAAKPGPSQTILVTRGRDVAGVPCAVTRSDGVLKAHVQTDRPIYRPGQTVLFKVILRRTQGRGYQALANTACHLEVRDPKDNVLWEKQATSNAVGTISDEFEVPAEGLTGPYTIVVTVGEDSAYETFSVAEYRKPEFKASVAPAAKRYLAGEEAAFEAQCAYYFGAPVPQAEVRYQVRRNTSLYGTYDELSAWYASSDGNLYPRDTYAASPFVAEGTVHTDDAGRVRIPVKTDKAAPDSVYQITCTVQDSSRRQVQATGSVPVYAANLRLALETDVVVAPLGSVIPLRVKAADLDGKPAAARVTLIEKQPVWIEKEGRYRFKELTRTEVSIPPGGAARAALPAGAEDTVLITATAPDWSGRTASAELSVWVAGPFAKAQVAGKEPRLQLRLDRKSYKPGDTVTAWVTTSVASRPILVTAEGGDLWQYAVLSPGRKPIAWHLKTSLAMSPNAYLSAEQWSRSRLLSSSALVPLPDLSRKLTVQVEPEKAAYRPGDTARYLVRTTAENGRPVPAEVAITVVDEAICALRPDMTRDLYTTYWGIRENRVVTNQSAPEELSGGAYQRVSAMAPVRERFLDTAYWNAQATTGTDGVATVSFELPGNLTTWRATGRAVTEDTRVGTGEASVQVSRPVMLRLATPRQLVTGDRLVLIGTVSNRTDAAHEFETAISAQGVRVEGETTKRVAVPGGGEGTVSWTIVADVLPESGEALITGRTLATDAPRDRGPEFSDALRLPVRVVPAGVAQRIVVAGVLARETTATLALPPDRIEPATMVKVTIRAGLKQTVEDLAARVLASGRYGSPGAADSLIAAAILGREAPARAARESLALLSRSQLGNGAWGWWEQQPPDAFITTRVLLALIEARSAGIPVPAAMLTRGIAGATRFYNETNLWEHRALLASAATLAGAPKASDLLAEVHRRATHLSPYAQLLLARAYDKAGQKEWAQESAAKALDNAAVGPQAAYLPGGEHPGWSADTVETTAQALSTLLALSQDAALQAKLAQWLVEPEGQAWWCQDESVAATEALASYVREHPQPERLGDLEIVFNGTPLKAPVPAGKPAQAVVPRSLLRESNTVTLRRDGDGEAFFSIEAQVFRPADGATANGVTIMRRYEVCNAAGLWDEVSGPIKPAEPVRCTVLVWPDDRPDALRVAEPIPAGFEFVDSEHIDGAREEVRDGAVIHYLLATGKPAYFRYYLRAESDGSVLSLPGLAEALRRPTVRGTAGVLRIEVKG